MGPKIGIEKQTTKQNTQVQKTNCEESLANVLWDNVGVLKLKPKTTQLGMPEEKSLKKRIKSDVRQSHHGLDVNAGSSKTVHGFSHVEDAKGLKRAIAGCEMTMKSMNSE